MKDVISEGRFKTIENISLKLSSKKGKCNVIHDYAKLRKAIPKLWTSELENMDTNLPMRDSNLKITFLFIGDNQKHISDCSSKFFYSLTPPNYVYTNANCIYWEGKLGIDIDWSVVFKRNLVQIQECKLREFNFKLLYNVLPVRRNLHKWGLVNDNLCVNCQSEEDIRHAFISCELNKPFYEYLKRIILQMFRINLEINYTLLFKRSR